MSSEPDFTKLLQAVHGKLGTVQLCELRNTGVAWFAGQGATVTLVYNTRFQSTYAAASFSIFSKTTQIRAFFRETSVAPFRSNLVSDANKRVTQILRSFDPGSSSRSEAREASDVGFDH